MLFSFSFGFDNGKGRLICSTCALLSSTVSPPLSIAHIIMNCCRSPCSCMNKSILLNITHYLKLLQSSKKSVPPFNPPLLCHCECSSTTSISAIAEHSLFTQSISSGHINVDKMEECYQLKVKMMTSQNGLFIVLVNEADAQQLKTAECQSQIN